MPSRAAGVLLKTARPVLVPGRVVEAPEHPGPGNHRQGLRLGSRWDGRLTEVIKTRDRQLSDGATETDKSDALDQRNDGLSLCSHHRTIGSFSTL